MKKITTLLTLAVLMVSCGHKTPDKNEVLDIINKVNNHWQTNNPAEVNPFWDNAAYHTGNMEVYALTGNEEQLAYTKRWAEHNNYWGATGTDKTNGATHTASANTSCSSETGRYASRPMPTSTIWNLTL